MKSKSVVSNYKTGQQVIAKVTEILPGGGIIAGFEGDLLRIKNLTGEEFRIGEAIVLEVISVRPLGFRMAERRRTRSSYRISV